MTGVDKIDIQYVRVTPSLMSTSPNAYVFLWVEKTTLQSSLIKTIFFFCFFAFVFYKTDL